MTRDDTDSIALHPVGGFWGLMTEQFGIEEVLLGAKWVSLGLFGPLWVFVGLTGSLTPQSGQLDRLLKQSSLGQ